MAHTKRQTELKDVYALTIKQTAEVFNIGERTIRKLVKQNPKAPYVFTIGNRTMIKREMFEKMLSETSVL
jgi:excisionase family DNA binding protein